MGSSKRQSRFLLFASDKYISIFVQGPSTEQISSSDNLETLDFLDSKEFAKTVLQKNNKDIMNGRQIFLTIFIPVLGVFFMWYLYQGTF